MRAWGSRNARLRTRFASRVAVVLAAVGTGVAASSPASAAATPAFVQSRANEVTSGKTNAAGFFNANQVGDLVAVYMVWNNAGAVTLADTRGNAYAAATPRVA